MITLGPNFESCITIFPRSSSNKIDMDGPMVENGSLIVITPASSRCCAGPSSFGVSRYLLLRNPPIPTGARFGVKESVASSTDSRAVESAFGIAGAGRIYMA
jgi:hypothetical protein